MSVGDVTARARASDLEDDDATDVCFVGPEVGDVGGSLRGRAPASRKKGQGGSEHDLACISNRPFVRSFSRSRKVVHSVTVEQSQTMKSLSRRVAGVGKMCVHFIIDNSRYVCQGWMNRLNDVFSVQRKQQEFSSLLISASDDVSRDADEESRRGGDARHPFRLYDDVQPMKRTVRLDARDEGYQNAHNRE